jgi:hypothetical protein
MGLLGLKIVLLYILKVFDVEIKIQVTEMPTIFRWLKLARQKNR